MVPLGRKGNRDRITVSQVFPPLLFDPSNFDPGDVLCADVLSSPVCGGVRWRVGLGMLDTQGLGSPCLL